MSSELSSSELLQRGRDKLAAFRAAKQQEAQQHNQHTQQTYEQQENEHHHMNGNGVAHHAESHASEPVDQQTEEQPQQPQQSQPTVEQLQQQYAYYMQQYGNDPQYAGYFQQLRQQIEYALAQQQQQQHSFAQQQEAQAAQPSQPVDYSSCATVSALSPDQRSAFLNFAAYYTDPNYAGYYEQLRAQPEYEPYFALMNQVQLELQAGSDQPAQQTAATVPTVVEHELSAGSSSPTTENHREDSLDLDEQKMREEMQMLANQAQHEQEQQQLQQQQQQTQVEPSIVQDESYQAAVIENGVDEPASADDSPVHELPVAGEPSVDSSLQSESLTPVDQPIEEIIPESTSSFTAGAAPSLETEVEEPVEEVEQQHEQQQYFHEQSPLAQQQQSEEPQNVQPIEEAQYQPESLSTHSEPIESQPPQSSPLASSTSLESVNSSSSFSDPSHSHSLSQDHRHSLSMDLPLDTPSRASSAATAEIVASVTSTDDYPQADERESLVSTPHSVLGTEMQDASLESENEESTRQQRLQEEQMRLHYQQYEQYQQQQQYIMQQQLQQQQQQQQQLQQQSQNSPIEATGTSPSSDERSSMLSELNQLREALAKKDAEINALAHALPSSTHTPSTTSTPTHPSSALMQGDVHSDPTLDAAYAAKQGLNRAQMTIQSLSTELDNLRKENDKLIHQQSLLRGESESKNGRMEQISQDNVALLLEMEKLEEELEKVKQQHAESSAQERKALMPPTPEVVTVACNHGPTFTELHEFHTQLSHVLGQTKNQTLSMDEALRQMHGLAGQMLIQQQQQQQQQLQLTSESSPTGHLSFTPDVRPSQDVVPIQRERSNSDPNVGAQDNGVSDDSQQQYSQSEFSTPHKPAHSPDNQQLVPSATATSPASALIPYTQLPSMIQSITSLHQMLQGKAQSESQFFAILQRCLELSDPTNALLSSGANGSDAVHSVTKAMQAMQKRRGSDSKPGAVVPVRNDAAFQQELSELRTARDNLALQLQSQLERSNLLIKDKILLAKKIEDTFEEREMVVSNLRETIAQLQSERNEEEKIRREYEKRLESVGVDPNTINVAENSDPTRHDAHDRAFSPSGDAPAGAAGSVEANDSSSSSASNAAAIREVNNYYVNSKVNGTAPSSVLAAAEAIIQAKEEEDERERAQRRSRRKTRHLRRADRIAELHATGAISPIVPTSSSGGLLSSLISFFVTRFSQRGYEQALRQMEEQKRQQQIDDEQLEAEVVII